MILITGAAGSLGSAIAKRLMGRGKSVRCMIRPQEQLPAALQGMKVVRATLEDTISLAHASRGVDVIVHCAAVTHTNDEKIYYRTNYEGTKNLIAAAPPTLKNFIYISTTALGKEAGAYGHSKYLAEEALKQSGISYSIIRPSEVYGAPKRGMIERLANIVQKMPIIPLVGDGRMELAPVYVDDVVGAIVQAALLAPKNIVYILAGYERMTYKNFLRKIGEMQGIKNRIFIPVPVFLWRIATELGARLGMKFMYRDQIPRLLAKKNYDIRAARRDLHFQPRSLRDAFMRKDAPL